DRLDRWLRQALHEANLAVYDHSRSDPDVFGCQSTASALLFREDSCVIAHAGDCRVYRIRGDAVEQRTTDHTRAAEMVRLRILTPEQALHHPARSQLTRSLGAEVMVHVDVVRDTLRQGDVYVVCSDGLWNEVSRAEVAAAVREAAPAEAAEELLDLALNREASDNVTVVVVRIDSVEPASAERSRRWLPWR
ncbi:MAG: serine/threonine-protein phosphatase, partial [Candidatus Dormibacteraeota bacterium]|nr:serine/threonine-protein phosphatase [Candidatus Dormibacteraeota bacterium]